MSDLGHRTYVSYWTNRVLNILLRCNAERQSISILNISEETGMIATDIQYVLESFEILRCQNGRYFMFTEDKYLQQILEKKGRKFREVKANLIHWVPNNIHAT